MTTGIKLDNLDQSTSPQDNFYRFVNGGWIDRNPISAKLEYSRWGAFEEVDEKSNEQLKVILEECSEKVLNHDESEPPLDIHTSAIGSLYASGMDEKACNEFGFSPLSDVFQEIEMIQSTSEIFPLKARLTAEFGVHGGLFAIYSKPDAKNSKWEVAALSQSSALGIGDRDFYILADKKEIRDHYIAHLQRLLTLSGIECNEQNASEILELETSLAEKMLSRTERRDPKTVYNSFESIEDFAMRTETADQIQWNEVFKLFGFENGKVGKIIVDNPKYFTYLVDRLNTYSLSTWRQYLRYHVLRSMSSYLSEEAESELFYFHNEIMVGQRAMKPRWKRVLRGSVSGLLQDSLGMKYTQSHFSPSAKTLVLNMTKSLTEVLEEKLKNSSWMSEKTKEKALLKLSRFRPMIGYPDKWDENGISELAFDLDHKKSYASNVRLCNILQFRKAMRRINKPVDPNRWQMPAFMPPFLIQPTSEAPEGDPAINYSAIGAVICHEISHGYDDTGKQFDENGELANWWTEKDENEYKLRADKMVKLCEMFQVHGKNLNGKMCLGENIADLGGVKIAYEGLMRYQKEKGKLPEIDGFSAEQRFFMGWASIWRNTITEQNALKRVITDVHAPGEFRANIVQVVEEFHRAFDVQEGDEMWAPTNLRCDIW